MRRCFPLLAILLLVPSRAAAHSLAVYVSTPVSPPEGFQWVKIAALAALLLLNILLFRLRMPGKGVIWRPVLAVAGFGVVFYGFGVSSANMSTAPPPGLGSPYPVMWGMGWQEIGDLFVRWNVYGLLFLLASVAIAAKLKRWQEKRSIRLLLASNAAVYLLFLLPYISTGALAHGWGGLICYYAL